MPASRSGTGEEPWGEPYRDRVFLGGPISGYWCLLEKRGAEQALRDWTQRPKKAKAGDSSPLARRPPQY